MKAFVTILALLASLALTTASPPASRPPPSPNNTWWQRRNFNTVLSIYNKTISPNNVPFLTSGISALPPNLFSPNVSGRITPIGNSSGPEDSVEYFFGLTPPAHTPPYLTWTSARLASFTSGCPEVAASVVYDATTGINANYPATYGKQVTSIKQVAFWHFHDQGRVLYYDAWLPTLSAYTKQLYGTPSTNTTFQGQVIAELCNNTQTLCTGSNEQYSSTQACVAQLSQKDFGDWNELWADNVICRTLHVLLAKLRPDVHCKHVGPDGGGKCVDVDYDQVYFEDDEALFGLGGDAFVCPGVRG